MTLSLRSMDAESFDTWMAASRAAYIESRVQSGESPQKATDNADRSFARYFPDGRPHAEQVVFDVVRAASEGRDGQDRRADTDDPTPVGYVWIGLFDAANAGWYVYDIEIVEAQRGRGYGRETMMLAEAEARARGARTLGLNVLGFNTVARRLYESLGYEPTSIQMQKPL